MNLLIELTELGNILLFSSDPTYAVVNLPVGVSNVEGTERSFTKSNEYNLS
jgi:hypothetical protein